MSLHLTKAFDAPGPHPNGMQATTEGLWILDQGNNKVTCQSYRDGTVLKSFDTESDRGSGITLSGTHLWISSTYTSEVLKCDPTSGDTIARYPAPGAGKTGSHGLEWVNGELWVTTPPSATIYRVNPETWKIIHSFPAPGDRPHGLAWENGRLWCVDTNENAVFLYDPRSGEQVERVAVVGTEPHGFTLWQGEFWICDATTREVYRGIRD